MKTRVIYDIAEAAAILRRGGLVAFPTETVFGLGADATSDAAIKRLFAAKGRPSDNPLIVHLADSIDWPAAARQLTKTGRAFLKAFSPGPITVVLPKANHLSPQVTASLDSVGIRVPKHPQARQLLQAVGLPVAAPSANRSGRPSSTTWQAVLEDLDGRIDAVLAGTGCGIGVESTVVDCTGTTPILLRPGGIALADLRRIVPETQVWQAVEAADPRRSPGLLHPHYQPHASVHLFQSAQELSQLEPAQFQDSGICLLGGQDMVFPFALRRDFDSLEDYARGFYEFLREVDRRRITSAYVMLAPTDGIGAALRDRQLRAAAHQTP